MAKLTLRSVKGSPLTNTELDGNFEYFTGSHAITGSLIVTGGITGSLHSVISSSYAATASNAVSASYAQTASYAENAQTASYVENAQTASYVSTASYAENALSASYAPSTSPFPYVGDAEFSGSILISGSIIPNTDGVSLTSSFSLGSPTAAWKDIYVSDGTINFLDGAGNVQGTIGAGTNATVITGSLVTVPSLPLTGYAHQSTLLHKSYTTSDCILALATSPALTSGPNPVIYYYGSTSVLPWDKKITSYVLYNNINANSGNVSSLVSLPPIFNAGYSIGETVTVYNIGKAITAFKETGSIYITAFAQGINAVNTASKTITSYHNNGYILSGSWGSYTNLNRWISATTESIKIDPGQKATFELVYMGDLTPGVTASLYNVPGNGYSTNQTNVNPSSTYVTYLFKGIENL